MRHMRHFTLALSAATVLALAAPPALAASAHRHRHAVVRGHYAHPWGYGYYGRPYNAGGVDSPGPIFRNGYYLGSDPDPNIRFELIRDPWYARGRW